MEFDYDIWKELLKLDEDGPYSSKDELDIHLKHRDENASIADMSDEEFNCMGDYLYTKDVDNINIFGYKTIRNDDVRYCKWDKNTHIFICYDYRDGKPYTVTCYKKNQQNYERGAKNQSKGEIPKGM